MTISDFLFRFHNRLNYYLDLMESSWGYRPKIEMTHGWLARVDCTYEPALISAPAPLRRRWRERIRKFFIKQAVSNRTRSPARIALSIVDPHGKLKKAGKGREPYTTADAWFADFHKELEVCLQAKPTKVKVETDQGLSISVNFNIDGFAHKGQTVYATTKNMKTHRKPELVARMFVAEITSHRNTCNYCGIGVAPVSSRAKGFTWGGLDIDVLPDPVEEKIHPRLSNLLKQRLAKKGINPLAPVCPVKRSN